MLTARATTLQGYLSINYSDNYYLLSQRFPEVPRLTQQHYEAMALFNKLAASQELRLEMILQPGDIQLLNNHTCLHYRSAFEDYPVSHGEPSSTAAFQLLHPSTFHVLASCESL
jgi:hypothetical protein